MLNIIFLQVFWKHILSVVSSADFDVYFPNKHKNAIVGRMQFYKKIA